MEIVFAAVLLSITLIASAIYVGMVVMGAEQDVVDQVTAQLRKASGEIVAKIEDLEAQVAAGEVPDFTELRAAAQALDDVVPDAVEEAPAEEEPVDEEPVE